MGSISFLLIPNKRAWTVAGLVAKKTGPVGEKGEETTPFGMMTGGTPCDSSLPGRTGTAALDTEQFHWEELAHKSPVSTPFILGSNRQSLLKHKNIPKTTNWRVNAMLPYDVVTSCPGQHYPNLNEETQNKKHQWIRLMGKLRWEHTLDKWLIPTDLTYSFRNNSEVLYSFWTQCWWQNVAESHQTHNHLHLQSVGRSVFSQQLKAVWSGNYNSVHIHKRLLRTRPLPSTSCTAALQGNCSTPARLWKWGMIWLVLFAGQQKNICSQRRIRLPSAGDYAPHIDNMII